MFLFEDTTAVVVGAAGGIGRALALEFARRGARVVAADIDYAGADITVSQINDAGGRALALGCDVTDGVSLAAAVTAAEDFGGPIDVCANAVGVLLSGNPEDIPFSEWERIFRVNVFGAARLNELVMPKMIARGRGYIVNTASVAGLHPFAITRVPYAASKAALISMSENLAIYLKPKGVRVSCLCPGPTVTAITGSANNWSEGVPMVGPGGDYRLMTPQQSAEVFCDGMEAERVIILAQEHISLGYLQQFATSPDQFIDERIEQYARGDDGLPEVDLTDPEILRAFEEIQQGS